MNLNETIDKRLSDITRHNTRFVTEAKIFILVQIFIEAISRIDMMITGKLKYVTSLSAHLCVVVMLYKCYINVRYRCSILRKALTVLIRVMTVYVCYVDRGNAN